MTTENTSTGAESQETTASATESTESTQTESQQTEQGQEQQQAERQEAEKPKVVPLAALHEERNMRKQLQQDMARLRQEQAERDQRLNERLAKLFPEQEPQAPNPQENGVGYIDHRIGQVEKLIKPLADTIQQQREQQERAQLVSQLSSRVRASEAAMRQVAPDYDDAVNHLARIRAAEMAVYGASPDQIAALLPQDMERMALTWANEGRNPAEVAYNLARARGYTPKAAQQQAQQAAQQQSAEEKITAQQRGTQAARSLGSGGGVSKGKLTAQALASMSDEDFAKLSESEWRQAMGG